MCIVKIYSESFNICSCQIFYEKYMITQNLYNLYKRMYIPLILVLYIKITISQIEFTCLKEKIE